MSLDNDPEITVVFEIDGITLPCTIEDTKILRFTGREACLDCLYHNWPDGHYSAIFDSLSEQEDLIYYGWQPLYFRYAGANVLDAYYQANGLPPEARN